MSPSIVIGSSGEQPRPKPLVQKVGTVTKTDDLSVRLNGWVFKTGDSQWSSLDDATLPLHAVISGWTIEELQMMAELEQE